MESKYQGKSPEKEIITSMPNITALVHEINNLLTGISGAITVIFNDKDPGDPKKEIINEILSQIIRLNKAVRELLSFMQSVEGIKDG